MEAFAPLANPSPAVPPGDVMPASHRLPPHGGEPGSPAARKLAVTGEPGLRSPLGRPLPLLRSLRFHAADKRVAWSGAVDADAPARPHRPVTRQVAAQALGIAGLLAYNWWVLVPLRPGLMVSPSELFSDLEVPGQPFAAAMQHADLLSGLLLLSAFSIVGSKVIPRGRGEWWSIVVFASAGVTAALFPEACPDGISAACRHLEWTFQLPVHHYIHIVASVFEFGAITAALWLAYRRTREQRSPSAMVYRILAVAALPAYLLLGAAYLFNAWGGAMEAVFFVAFSAIVVTELFERTRAA